MRTMYAIYIMLEKGSFHLIHHTWGEDEMEDHFFKVELQALDEIGVRCVRCFYLTNYGLFLKMRLKWKLRELRRFNEGYELHIQHMRNLNVDEETIERTREAQEEYISSLMIQVAILVGRCMSADVEVDDELAHVCYNYRKSKCAEVTF